MALTRNIIEKINAKTADDPQMGKGLKRLLNRCEEGRQTKKTIEEVLKKLKKKDS